MDLIDRSFEQLICSQKSINNMAIKMQEYTNGSKHALFVLQTQLNTLEINGASESTLLGYKAVIEVVDKIVQDLDKQAVKLMTETLAFANVIDSKIKELHKIE